MAHKILIIDDEEDIAKVLQMRLKSRSFETDCAYSGKEGLAKINSSAPDLIILDIMMPDMTGAEVAAELRKNKATAGIPVLFLSALQSKEEEKQGGGMIGGNVIFAKPYEIDALVAKINQMLGISQ